MADMRMIIVDYLIKTHNELTKSLDMYMKENNAYNVCRLITRCNEIEKHLCDLASADENRNKVNCTDITSCT